MLFPIEKPVAKAPRVVVTGMGIVTPLGLGWKANSDGFRNGRSCFRSVTLFDVSRQRVKIAAEVDLPRQMPLTALKEKQIRRLDRGSQMLIHALHEAWTQAGRPPSIRSPLILGTTSGGMALGEDYYRQAIAHPLQQRRQPTRALHYLAHTQARLVMDALELEGWVRILANACASGANAIGHGWELIRSGRFERVITAGYDALSLLVFAGFDTLQALSPTICRPFDKNRDGLSLGEGAAAFVLETESSARDRGAEILGEIAGYGATIDCSHLTHPHPEGDAAYEVMTKACHAAGITAQEVDYVNAHGTGTVINDRAEALAINRWAGDHVGHLAVNSIKASIGHLLGGAGAVEAAACLMALKEQWLPPQIHIDEVDPVCQFPILNKPSQMPANYALSNSFGFGGANAALVLRRWP